MSARLAERIEKWLKRENPPQDLSKPAFNTQRSKFIKAYPRVKVAFPCGLWKPIFAACYVEYCGIDMLQQETQMAEVIQQWITRHDPPRTISAVATQYAEFRKIHSELIGFDSGKLWKAYFGFKYLEHCGIPE